MPGERASCLVFRNYFAEGRPLLGSPEVLRDAGTRPSSELSRREREDGQTDRERERERERERDRETERERERESVINRRGIINRGVRVHLVGNCVMWLLIRNREPMKRRPAFTSFSNRRRAEPSPPLPAREYQDGSIESQPSSSLRVRHRSSPRAIRMWTTSSEPSRFWLGSLSSSRPSATTARSSRGHYLRVRVFARLSSTFEPSWPRVLI